MEKHFNTIKNSDLTFDTSFYNEVAKAVGQNDFVVRGCLTWSLNHQFEKPATVEMFPDSLSRILVSPMKICCFQSIDVMIIIFKFIRTVYLHLKLYEILNFIVLVIDQ